MIQTVTFVDEGQDFLEWDIEFSEEGKPGEVLIGKVVDCRPFQADTWIGTEVYGADIRPGDLLSIVPRSTGKRVWPRPTTLNHPVKSVKRI